MNMLIPLPTFDQGQWNCTSCGMFIMWDKKDARPTMCDCGSLEFIWSKQVEYDAKENLNAIIIGGEVAPIGRKERAILLQDENAQIFINATYQTLFNEIYYLKGQIKAIDNSLCDFAKDILGQ